MVDLLFRHRTQKRSSNLVQVILIGASLLGFVPLALAQTVPPYVANSPLLQLIKTLPEGGWAKVNTNLYSDVWTPDDLRPLYGAGNPFPYKIIETWSGFAWDTNRGDLIIYGGGHHAYSGNDVYRWRSSTLQWERAALPSEVTPLPTVPNVFAWTAIDGVDAAPTAAHTYDNNIFLPIANRFLTWGGALFDTGGGYVRLLESDPTQFRRTGPYLFDPAKADANKVGGTTGSHVQRVAPHPEIVGGNMWQNRDIYKNLAGSTFPIDHVNGCTGYAQENGHDVVYAGARTGSSLNLYRYELVDLGFPMLDRFNLVGIFWNSTADQTTCDYEAQKKLFVRTGNNTIPFVFWDLTAPGPSNKDQNVDVTGSLVTFQNWLSSTGTTLGNCAMDLDPVRQQHLIWCGAGAVWALNSPAANVTYGWSMAQQPAPTTVTPPGDIRTGILGKWKYIPYFDVFMGLMGPNNGDIWVYKPVGWQPSTLLVALTSPTSGSVVMAGTTLNVTASVTATPGSTVTKVEFFANGASIGQVTSAPYTLSWTPAQAGNYLLAAKATDNSGGSATSAGVSVLADAPPTVSISSPASGAMLTQGTAVNVTAAAADSDGTVAKVEFFANGISIGQDTSAPYTVSWIPAQAGSYTLTAKATDNFGATGVSGPVAVQVGAGSGSATVVLQQQPNGYAGTSDVYLDSYTPTTKWGASPLLQLSGNAYTALIRFAIFASEGGPVPNGASIQSATLQIYKEYYNYIYQLNPMLRPWDQSQATWQMSLNGVPWAVAGANGVGSDYASSFDAQFSAGWDPGWMSFDVTNRIQQYAAGSPNYGWRLQSVSGYNALRYFHSSEYANDPTTRPILTIRYASNAPPSVSLTAPSAGAVFTIGNPVTLSASATDSDGMIAKVEFFANGISIGQDTSAPYTVSWIPAQAGSYTLTAKATDNFGATGVSGPVAVQVGAGSGSATVVLQQQPNGYAGTSDVYLDSYTPTTKWGASPLLQLSGNAYTALIRFAIFASEGGPVPNGASIQSATLQIYKEYYNYIYQLNPMLRPWDQSQATWQMSLNGVPWAVAGANGVGSDYASSFDAQFSAGWDPGWMSFDVTNRIQQYAAGSPNYGWRLQSVSGWNALRYFHSSEYVSDPSTRPKLTVTFAQ